MVHQQALIRLDALRQRGGHEGVGVDHDVVRGGDALDREVAQRVDGVEPGGVLHNIGALFHVVWNRAGRDALPDIEGDHEASLVLNAAKKPLQFVHLLLLHEERHADGSAPALEKERHAVDAIQSTDHRNAGDTTIAGT